MERKSLRFASLREAPVGTTEGGAHMRYPLLIIPSSRAERSEVEGPSLQRHDIAHGEKVPPLRLAARGSGRDDGGWGSYAISLADHSVVPSGAKRSRGTSSPEARHCPWRESPSASPRCARLRSGRRRVGLICDIPC